MIPKKPTKSRYIAVRLTEQQHTAFSVKAAKYGGTSYTLRELIAAFIESRLTVKPPRKTKESLYE